MRRVVLLFVVMGLASLLASGVALAKNFTGGPGDNTIRGTPNADNIRGRGGDDRLFGLAGDDTVFGQRGSDDLFGGEDQDELFGSRGKDDLFGEGGADELVGGPGRDDAFGGEDDDRIDLRDGMPDQVDCGPGFDTLFLDPALDTAAPGADPDTANCEVFNP